ncbi:AsmA family protein [Ectothiorhodospira mobilis]|uniref:AsmA family protein n=1 Tax=Ectothiorhodospira mobilis TaxID=195064 RepID=UPI001EE7FD60|nr:AsmA family protein [Ectothiorhodospira mobilis]MCG5534897.1 AsmA family protein [Ectothiorhodospira mobilis]
MKWIKRSLVAVMVLLVVLVALAGVVLITVDPNDYKEEISAAVEQRTGRNLEIRGDIGLSLFPRLGLELGETTLANAEGFAGDHFARVRQVDVSVALLPLLRRELEVQQVRLEGLDLNLARDAEGRGNWEGLTAAPAAEEAPTPEAEAGEPVPPALRGLDIAGVRVRDARVSWRDDQAGTEMTIDPFDLTLGHLRMGEEAPLEISLRLRMPDPGLDARLETQGLLMLDPAGQRYGLRQMVTRMDARGEALPAPVEARLEADLVADLASGLAKVERLTLDALETRWTGLVEVTGLNGTPRVHGELRSNRFNPRKVLKALEMPPPETTDPEVLTQAALDLAFDMQGERLEVDQLLMTLDESTLSGGAGLQGFAQPAVTFDIDLDRIDLDRYLPPAPEGESGDHGGSGAGDGKTGSGAWPDTPIALPMDILRGLDLDGTFQVDDFRVSGLQMQGVSLKVKARDGRLDVESIRGNLYDGSLEGRLGLDVRQDTPAYSAGAALSSVRIGPLLDDLTGDGKLTGTGDVNLSLSSRGDSVRALVSALDGNGDLRFRDGAVQGINIAQVIRRAEARLRGRDLEEDAPRQTDFTELTASFSIDDGLVRNDDLQAASPLLRVRGQGEVDLPPRRLDYRVDTSLVATLEGQGGRPLDNLRNLNLPITVQGTFDDPRIGLDLESVLKARVEQEAEQAREEVEQRAREEADAALQEQEQRLKEEAGRLQEELLDRFR